MALSKQTDEQRLRAAARELRGVRLCSYDALDGETFGSLMRLFRRFHCAVLQIVLWPLHQFQIYLGSVVGQSGAIRLEFSTRLAEGASELRLDLTHNPQHVLG